MSRLYNSIVKHQKYFTFGKSTWMSNFERKINHGTEQQQFFIYLLQVIKEL